MPENFVFRSETMVKAVVGDSGVAPESVAGIGLDCTASTVLPLDESGTPMCFQDEYRAEPHAYIKLWKHHGAQRQADRIA